MDIDLQLKKSSSQTKCSRKNAEIILKITKNAWWPFDRVDGRLLEKLHKESQRAAYEAAPM